MTQTPPLMEHQKEGVSLCIRGNAFLAFEPGLGKTRTTIEALDHLGIQEDILVVCPAIARNNWKDEFDKWGTISRDVHIQRAGHGTPPGVFITSYESIARMTPSERNVMLQKAFKVVILDEAHRVKSLTAKRTMMLYGHHATMRKAICANAKYVWCLSGTPAPNHAGELYTHLRALYPSAILGLFNEPMTYPDFEKAFCTTKNNGVFGRQVTGSRNIPELRRRMQKFFLPKRVENCVDLPPLIIDTKALHVRDVKDQKVLKELDDKMRPIAEAPDTLTALRQEAAHLSTERKMLGMLKAPLAAELILTEVEGMPPGQKLLAFFHHPDVGKAVYHIVSQGTGVAYIDGSINQRGRDMALQRFQTDPNCRVFLGQMTATGEALNLTQARRVILIEPSWTPKDNIQCIKRAHRMGQKDKVYASYVTLAGSLDHRIMRAVVKKSGDILKIMG